MNKPSRLIALFFSTSAIASTMLLSSCGKDDDSIRPKVEIPTKFSELTVEENKAELEDNGIALVNSMTSLKNTQGVQTAIALDHFVSVAALPENGRASTNNKAVKMMLLLSKFGMGKATASDVLKGARIRAEEEPGTPQEVFDDLKGTYTFNSTTSEWTYTAGTDKIIFIFPATQTGTTNTAELSIYGLTSKTIVNSAAEYEGDVPTALKADLSVNGTKVIEYNWSASYKDNGEPTSVVTSLVIGSYKFAFKAKNTTSEIAVDYSLTENGTNLVSFGAGASGNFNSDNINESESTGDVVTSSSAYFQIMNIRFAGVVKAKSLSAALEAATTASQEAAAYNEHVELVVFYADSKQKIADSEFYSTTKTDSWTWCWDSNDDGIDECETYESEPYDVIEVRLIFADASKADLATYTDVGFEELETELEEFSSDLEDDFGG